MTAQGGRMHLGAALVVFAITASAQTSGRPPQKQVDIGAADAPLSDAERVDLDKAVAAHDYAAEKAVIDKAAGGHPNSFELLVLAGRLAYLERQPKDAAEALEHADKIKALAEQDRMTLGLAYEFAGQPEKSRSEFMKLAMLAPKNAEYLYLLGRVDRENRRLEAAADDFARTIRLDPKFVRAYEDLGAIQEEQGHAKEARKTYETGAAVNRQLPVPWERSPLDLGVVLLRANEMKAAEELFREALRYSPRFGWGHYYLGQVFQKLQRDNDAIAEYKEAVVDDPRLRQAWSELGKEFNRQGNKVEAHRALAISRKLEQQNASRGKVN
jgi:tetratricopeptide (TPR) repeat protein